MDAQLAGDGADGAAHDHRRHVDAAQLQPFGGADVVGVLPGAREGRGGAVPRQRLAHDDLLSEFVEGQHTGEGRIGGQCDDDVGLVALGRARKIEPETPEPGGLRDRRVRIAGGVHAAAELGQLLRQDRHADTGRGFDPRDDLPFGQRIELRQRDAPEQRGQRFELGRIGQRLGRGDQRRGIVGGGDDGGGRLGVDRVRGLRLHRGVCFTGVILGAGAAQQIVVEVVVMQRHDDLVRDVGPVQAVRERRSRLAAGVSSIGVDGDAPGALGPLKPRQTVGRQRRPDRCAEERVSRERRLDPLGDADVTILRHREEPDHGILHAAEHLLAGRRLRAAVVEQEGTVDTRRTLPVRQPQDRDQAGPAAAAVEVGKVGVEQQVGRSGIRQPAGAEESLARRACDRHGPAEKPRDLGRMVRASARGRRWRRPQHRMAHPRKPCRLVEERAVAETGRLRDQVDGTGPLASGVIEAPAGIGSIEMDGAGALLARRAPGEVGAAQGSTVPCKPGLGKEPRQPVGGRAGQPLLHNREIVSGLRDRDVVEVDHRAPQARRTRPRSARVIAV
jgi:hypothetical protein